MAVRVALCRVRAAGRRIPVVYRPAYHQGHGDPGRPAQRGHRGPRRPRQDHPGRRDALAVRRLPGQPAGRRAGDGLGGAGAREGHHDPGQEHVGAPRRAQGQHRRHPGTRGLRRRGGAEPAHGRRRAAARRRLRGPAAPDPVRAAQGPGRPAAGGAGGQQGGPPRRAAGRGGGRGLRAVPRPRRRREPDRVPHRLRQRARRTRVPDGRRAGRRPRAPVRRAAGPRAGARLHARRAPAGPGHQPGRLELRGPAGRVPGARGDHHARRGGGLVPGRRHDRARPGERALRDRGARAGAGRVGRSGGDRRRRRPARRDHRRDPGRPRGPEAAAGHRRRRAQPGADHRHQHLTPGGPRRHPAHGERRAGAARGRARRQRLPARGDPPTAPMPGRSRAAASCSSRCWSRRCAARASSSRWASPGC